MINLSTNICPNCPPGTVCILDQTFQCKRSTCSGANCGDLKYTVINNDPSNFVIESCDGICPEDFGCFNQSNNLNSEKVCLAFGKDPISSTFELAQTTSEPLICPNSENISCGPNCPGKCESNQRCVFDGVKYRCELNPNLNWVAPIFILCIFFLFLIILAWGYYYLKYLNSVPKYTLATEEYYRINAS